MVMPLSIFWFTMAIGLLMYFLKRRRTAKLLFITAFVWLLIISTRPVPALLTLLLERSSPPFSTLSLPESGEPVNIVILGGGASFNDKLAPQDNLSLNSLGRLAEGLRIYLLYDSCHVYTSGEAGRDDVSQAYLTAEAAVVLGIASKDITMMETTTRTATEASEFAAVYNGGPLVLVTDAAHMPRALKLFRKNGLDPIPAPTNYLVKVPPGPRLYYFLPRAGNLKTMEAAVHEWVGIVVSGR